MSTKKVKIASGGKTKNGDKAKVAAHSRSMTAKQCRSIDADQALKQELKAAMHESDQQLKAVGWAIKQDPAKGLDFLRAVMKRSDWLEACRRTGLVSRDWIAVRNALPIHIRDEWDARAFKRLNLLIDSPWNS